MEVELSVCLDCFTCMGSQVTGSQVTGSHGPPVSQGFLKTLLWVGCTKKNLRGVLPGVLFSGQVFFQNFLVPCRSVRAFWPYSILSFYMYMGPS